MRRTGLLVVLLAAGGLAMAAAGQDNEGPPVPAIEQVRGDSVQAREFLLVGGFGE